MAREDIDNEAARWVARMTSSDATAEDREALRRWLAADPAHATAYAEFRALWGDLAPVSQAVRTRRRRVLATGAGLGILVLGTGLLSGNRLSGPSADYSTAVGEIRHATLPDGSELTLNTDSAVALRFSEQERRVALLRGEAFFAVVRDTARPFIVEEAALQAQVLGTRFSVARPTRDSGASVTVVEGRVEVSGSGDRVVLGPGESASLAAEGRLAVRRLPAEEALAWRDGNLVFSNRPLGEVLRTLEQYRQGRILQFGRGLEELRVSGVFSIRDTDQALAAMAGTLPISVTRLTRLLVVVRTLD
ncbi:FecR family protein [Roseococcus pinisoli]|uniref:FecR family protein n=1 Tax=Roseococcus pinisoli TaxID=2835040 RepID=A0ABS5QIW4_9PROT|nr:FecR family protein [Roseococcus pinisoli]